MDVGMVGGWGSAMAHGYMALLGFGVDENLWTELDRTPRGGAVGGSRPGVGGTHSPTLQSA
eukprot:364200-Chlamydomonas_euryale.AAC.2